MFALTNYNYDLPETFIAQKPAVQRDRSRLLFLNKKTGHLSHHEFYTLYDILSAGDLLVVNDTAVIPGRLIGKKKTGGRTEVLLLDYGSNCQGKTADGNVVCDCLIKASKPPKPGATIFFSQGLTAEVLRSQNEIFTLKFLTPNDFDSVLDRIGKVPLPPYIKRRLDDEAPCDDQTSYQTVYATQKGAIAAPTAGLHFTKELIEKLKSKGIRIAGITLHVGYGTFLPVKARDIRNHKIHSEWYAISEDTAKIINHTKGNGGRIVAVGTTCVRTLEYASDHTGNVSFGSGKCDLFIYPGYRFKVIDAMLTNFHLPRSTLLMLVAAFAGREKVLHAYKEAIKNSYRFYSYGDAMFIA